MHRFGKASPSWPSAIQRGDADAALDVLAKGGSNVEWISADTPRPATGRCASVRALAVESGRAAIESARAGDAAAALDALGRFRLLCAHRHGPEGVTTWTRQIESWLRADVEGFTTGRGAGTSGRPLIVTENDYGLQLYNGDIGVVVRARIVRGRRLRAGQRGRQVSPTRLAAVDTVYAMTVHKSQGSQFHTVAFLVPATGSRLLTEGAPLHRRDPGPGAPDRGGGRGVHPGGRRAPDLSGLGFAPSPVGRCRLRGIRELPVFDLFRLPQQTKSPGLTPMTGRHTGWIQGVAA